MIVRLVYVVFYDRYMIRPIAINIEKLLNSLKRNPQHHEDTLVFQFLYKGSTGQYRLTVCIGLNIHVVSCGTPTKNVIKYVYCKCFIFLLLLSLFFSNE